MAWAATKSWSAAGLRAGWCEPPPALAPTTAAPVAGPVDGSAALTEAGTALSLGEQAALSYQALNSGPDATKLEITVTEVARAPSTT